MSDAVRLMEDLVSLCKRRGFIFPASEIYGGINGFWDYGPLGVQLKNNLRDEWWRAMVLQPPAGPDGRPVQIVGLDSSIIQNPKVWEASGHVAGFSDPMVDCKACKGRFRADHVTAVQWNIKWDDESGHHVKVAAFSAVGDEQKVLEENEKAIEKAKRANTSRGWPSVYDVTTLDNPNILDDMYDEIPCPNCGQKKTITRARQFNLMFPTVVGAVSDWEEGKAYLRPETAQGIFVNYKNVVDTTRVKIPFGIAQVGKAFRNEVTPRNFVFRSREFEQMEMEWFCPENEAPQWLEFWKDERMRWWQSLSVNGENFIFRKHDADELAHYAKSGAGTWDIEYRWPFTSPGYGELEGIAHRSCFDLTQHAEHSGAKLEYFDQERNERYMPHVIEPAAGLTRGVLLLLCEAYTPDPERPSKVFMKFDPRLAPIKAAVYPLVNKDGMPEVAQKLHAELTRRFGRFGMIEYDPKQSIGKRYARMDEAGCPYCFTIDGETLTDQSVTMRDRDTAKQERIAIDKVARFLGDRLGL